MSSPKLSSPRSAALIVGVLLSSLAAGCGERVVFTAPDEARIGTDRDATSLRLSFDSRPYPLEIGNQWRYRRDESYESWIDGRPGVGLGAAWDVTRTIACEETRGGLVYRVEHAAQHMVDQPSTVSSTWIRYRQDREGLHELDLSISEPMACDDADGVLVAASNSGVRGKRDPGGSPLVHLVPRGWTPVPGSMPIEEKVAHALQLLGRRAGPAGGGLPPLGDASELLRLPQPLHAGATWWIRNEPGLQLRARVDGREVLDLPVGREVAWRVVYEWPGFFGPNDRVHLWYGGDGYLALEAHLETLYEDPVGESEELVIADIREEMLQKHLVGH